MVKDLPDFGFDHDLVVDANWTVNFSDRRAHPPHPLVRLWVLRALASLGDERLQMESDRESLARVFVAVGIRQWSDYRAGQPRQGRKMVVATRLHRLLKACEKAAIDPPEHLVRNASRIAELVGLSEVETTILIFAVMLRSDDILQKAIELLGEGLSALQAMEAMSTLLNVPEAEIRASLSLYGPLARSGLVKLDREGNYGLVHRLELLSPDFVHDMHQPEMVPADLLRGIVHAAPAPELTLADYEHVAPSLSILKPYLAKAVSSHRVGVNILVHGVPGTGKSQLARVMAQVLQCALFEVACENADGVPVEGEQRLRAVGAAQCFFTQQRTLLVFDEVEDAFNDSEGVFGRKSTAQIRKGWVNRMLESNRLPMFWLSNDAECLDPAFVRRFDLVIELKVPPKGQRERIIQNVCGPMLDTDTLARLAESDRLAPAVVARAAAVVSSIQDELGEPGALSAIELLINQTLQAQGHPSLRQVPSKTQSEIYDPVLVSASADLAALAQGLQKTRQGRLCLYGPPGTGKTAYGRWLADQLQMPLHVKRASDLLSMYVGGSERNIARAFTAAREDGAILILDEVDSFLKDRRVSHQSWENTQVNEMLVQMESFQGIFVASTNLIDNLDQAALRRFDMKVRFDYLKAEQAWRLLERYCNALALPAPPDALRVRLLRLDRLTPGDFAVAARQHAFAAMLSPEDLLKAMEAEVALKGGRTTSIGFI